MTPAQEHILDHPPVFLPAHLEWIDAKAAIALHDFEKADVTDTENLIRYGLNYRALIQLRDQVAARIEEQSEGRT